MKSWGAMIAYRFLMIRIPAMAVLLTGLASAAAGTAQSSPDKVPSTRDFGDIRREVEALRGKKFVHEVPVYQISEKELRAISDPAVLTLVILLPK